MTDVSAWFARPAARDWRCAPPRRDARKFHESFAEYRPTPLHEVPDLARELGVGRVFVKDESSRLGLPAFKMLGASWAVAELIATRAGLEHPTLETIRQTNPAGLVLVTATDGNHGRAVARMARLIGASAQIFVPEVIRQETFDAIASEGAEVVRVDGDYDEAVRAASVHAQEQPGAELVQDTAGEGYEQVPAWIVEGYETLLSEADEQLSAAGVAQPDLVVVPTGVGSLLQAVIAHYRSRAGSHAPAILSVEPTTAACVLASLATGRPTSVETDATVMAGLNCGSISAAAWPYIRDGLDAAVAVTDADALRAVDGLRSAGISSGPSGAASLAGARAMLMGSDARRRRQEFGISEASAVLLLSTEGDNRGIEPASARTSPADRRSVQTTAPRDRPNGVDAVRHLDLPIPAPHDTDSFHASKKHSIRSRSNRCQAGAGDAGCVVRGERLVHFCAPHLAASRLAKVLGLGRAEHHARCRWVIAVVPAEPFAHSHGDTNRRTDRDAHGDTDTHGSADREPDGSALGQADAPAEARADSEAERQAGAAFGSAAGLPL